MATTTITLTIKVRWWLRWYLAGVLLTSRVTGLVPDLAKVDYWIGRGVRFTVKNGSHAHPW
jgi:hypothetical protein